MAEVDDTPMMTPAERDRSYRAAYEQAAQRAAEGQYALALAAFEQALKLKPNSTDALFNLGACYEATGDPMRAIVIYRRVLEIDPDDADCYTNLGTSYIKMYYRDRSPLWRKMARDAWRRSLGIRPDQPEVQAFLAKSESLD